MVYHSLQPVKIQQFNHDQIHQPNLATAFDRPSLNQIESATKQSRWMLTDSKFGSIGKLRTWISSPVISPVRVSA